MGTRRECGQLPELHRDDFWPIRPEWLDRGFVFHYGQAGPLLNDLEDRKQVVFVADHFVWACNNAASTSGAQACIDDFFVQLFPLVRPALESCRGCFGNGHGNTLRHGLLAGEAAQLAKRANDLV